MENNINENLDDSENKVQVLCTPVKSDNLSENNQNTLMSDNSKITGQNNSNSTEIETTREVADDFKDN